MMDSVEITELDEMDPDSVHLVGKAANGLPALIAKAAAEEVADVLKSQQLAIKDDRDHEDKQLDEVMAVARGDLSYAETMSIGTVPDDVAGGEGIEKAEVSTKDQNDLADEAFAYIEPGGKKDADGKTTPRSKRHFPVMDAAHTRNALARAPQSPFGDKAMPKIKAAAAKFGIDVSKALTHSVKDATGKVVGWMTEPSPENTIQFGPGSTMSINPGFKIQGGTDKGTGQQIQTAMAAEFSKLAGDFAKADGDDVKCPTCGGDGKIRGGNLDCPDCGGDGKVTPAKAASMKKASTGDADTTPGDGPWETKDAGMWRAISATLADLINQVDAAGNREGLEVQAGQTDDMEGVCNANDAADALKFALGISAAMTFNEAQEASAAGMSKAVAAPVLVAIRKSLTDLPGDEGNPDDVRKGVVDLEVDNMTQDELSEFITKAVAEAVAASAKPADAEATDVAKAEGEETKAETEATDVAKAADTTTTEAEPVMKASEFEAMLKSTLSGAVEAAVKPLEDRLVTVETMAAPSRAMLGAAASAGAGGFIALRGEVMKGDADVAEIQKQIDGMSDPVEKNRLEGEKDRIRVRKAIEAGLL